MIEAIRQFAHSLPLSDVFTYLLLGIVGLTLYGLLLRERGILTKE